MTLTRGKKMERGETRDKNVGTGTRRTWKSPMRLPNCLRWKRYGIAASYTPAAAKKGLRDERRWCVMRRQ
jgi:hypothetical protein